MNTAEFIEHLRMERLRRRIQQGSLAALVEVRQSALSQWESGKTMPSDEHLRRWASALDVEVPEGVSGYVQRVAECGTYGGYERHRKLGEPTCTPCRRANNAYMKAWRDRRATQSHPSPATSGYVVHRAGA